jgi:hypothetical protein
MITAIGGGFLSFNKTGNGGQKTPVLDHFYLMVNRIPSIVVFPLLQYLIDFRQYTPPQPGSHQPRLLVLT